MITVSDINKKKFQCQQNKNFTYQSWVLGLGTWTAIVNELGKNLDGLGWIQVDSGLNILDAYIFQSTDESMSCVI